METSFIWENPGLTMLGILAGIFLILSPLIIVAVRRSRERSEDVVLRDREPSIHDDRSDDYYDELDDAGRFDGTYEDISNDRRSRRKRGSDRSREYADRGQSHTTVTDSTPSRRSGVAKMVWFLIGVGVGAGGLALWMNPPQSDVLATVLALLDRPGSTPVVAADERPENSSSAPEVSAGLAANGDGTTDVSDLVEGYVSELREQLPITGGPGISMVNADFKGNVVALGFTIAQTVAEEDAPKLQHELEPTTRPA